jgi:hypothetical protein
MRPGVEADALKQPATVSQETDWGHVTVKAIKVMLEHESGPHLEVEIGGNPVLETPRLPFAHSQRDFIEGRLPQVDPNPPVRPPRRLVP